MAESKYRSSLYLYGSGCKLLDCWLCILVMINKWFAIVGRLWRAVEKD